MPQIEWRRQAQDDLDEIFRYVLEVQPAAMLEAEQRVEGERAVDVAHAQGDAKPAEGEVTHHGAR